MTLRFQTVQAGETWVAKARFPTGRTVSVEFWDALAMAVLPSTGNAVELGATGVYVADNSFLDSDPTSLTHVVAIFTDTSTGQPEVGDLTVGGYVDDIATDRFDNAVTIDVANGTAGTAYPIGTPGTPSNNAADALTIATNRGFSKYFVRGSVTLTAEHLDWEFQGLGAASVATVDPGGFSVNGSRFQECTVTGSLGGAVPKNVNFEKCILDTLAGFDGIALESGIQTSLTLDAGPGASALLTSVATLDPLGTIVDANGANTIQWGGASGIITITGFTGGTLVFSSTASLLTLDAGNTGGLAILAGAALVTDSSAMTVFLDETLNRTVHGDLPWDELKAGHTTPGSYGALLPNKFGDRVWIDLVNGSAGGTGEFDDPVDSLSAAVTVAAAQQIRAYDIRGGTITLVSAHAQWRFYGSGPNTVVDLNGQDVDGSFFLDMGVTGQKGGTTAASSAKDCFFDSVSDWAGDLINCGLIGTLAGISGGGMDLLNTKHISGLGSVNVDGAPLRWGGHGGQTFLQNATLGETAIGSDGGSLVANNTNTAGALFYASGPLLITRSDTMNDILVSPITDVARQTSAQVGSTDTVIQTTLLEADGAWDGTEVVISEGGTTFARVVESYAQTNGAITLDRPLHFTPAPGALIFLLRRPGTSPIDVTGIADTVWDEILSGHTVAGSAGKILSDTQLLKACITSGVQLILNEIGAGCLDTSAITEPAKEIYTGHKGTVLSLPVYRNGVLLEDTDLTGATDLQFKLENTDTGQEFIITVGVAVGASGTIVYTTAANDAVFETAGNWEYQASGLDSAGVPFESQKGFQRVLERLDGVGEFSPLDISHIAQWDGQMQKTLGVGVSALGDLTGNGRDLVQVAGSQQPTETTWQGRGALDFDVGALQYLAMASSETITPAETSIWWVGQLKSFVSSGRILSWQQSALELLSGAAGFEGLATPTTLADPIAAILDPAWVLLTHDSATDEMRLYRNNVLIASGTSTFALAGASQIGLGAEFDGTNPNDLIFARGGVMDTVPTDAERLSLHTWIMERYQNLVLP